MLIPGVVGHATDFIEHPELVAERLMKYANLVGREQVIAGTDCGLGTRVGHPKIAWAKFQAWLKAHSSPRSGSGAKGAKTTCVITPLQGWAVPFIHGNQVEVH